MVVAALLCESLKSLGIKIIAVVCCYDTARLKGEAADDMCIGCNEGTPLLEKKFFVVEFRDDVVYVLIAI